MNRKAVLILSALVAAGLLISFGACLKEKGISPSPNSFWIIDGNHRLRQMDITQGNRAEIEFNPTTSGQLRMYERIDGGAIITYEMGYVRSGYSYQDYFIADYSGTHDVWYNVNNGANSPHVIFYVR